MHVAFVHFVALVNRTMPVRLGAVVYAGRATVLVTVLVTVFVGSVPRSRKYPPATPTTSAAITAIHRYRAHRRVGGAFPIPTFGGRAGGGLHLGRGRHDPSLPRSGCSRIP